MRDQPAESTLRPPGGSEAAIGSNAVPSLTPNANAATEASRGRYGDVGVMP